MNKKIDCNIIYSFAFAFSFILIFSFILKTFILIVLITIVIIYFSISNKIEFKDLNTQVKNILNCFNSEKVNNFSREVLDVYKTPEKINQNKINIDKECFNKFSNRLFLFSFYTTLLFIIISVIIFLKTPLHIHNLLIVFIAFFLSKLFYPDEKILDFIFKKKLDKNNKCFNKENYNIFKKIIIEDVKYRIESYRKNRKINLHKIFSSNTKKNENNLKNNTNNKNNNTLKKEETITLKEKLKNYKPSKDNLKKEEFEYDVDEKKSDKDFFDKETNFDFSDWKKSIWDDYESVLDIMKKKK